MPKQKTRKAVSARFKVTGTGLLKRNRPGKNHLLTKKSRKRKRQLRRSALVSSGFSATPCAGWDYFHSTQGIQKDVQTTPEKG